METKTLKCEYCEDGLIEIMGDGDCFEWDLIGHKPCNKCEGTGINLSQELN